MIICYSNDYVSLQQADGRFLLDLEHTTISHCTFDCFQVTRVHVCDFDSFRLFLIIFRLVFTPLGSRTQIAFVWTTVSPCAFLDFLKVSRCDFLSFMKSSSLSLSLSLSLSRRWEVVNDRLPDCVGIIRANRVCNHAQSVKIEDQNAQNMAD